MILKGSARSMYSGLAKGQFMRFIVGKMHTYANAEYVCKPLWGLELAPTIYSRQVNCFITCVKRLFIYTKL